MLPHRDRDYGILYPLLREIDNDKELNLHLLISGSHLSKEYGKTISEIIMMVFRIINIRRIRTGNSKKICKPQ